MRIQITAVKLGPHHRQTSSRRHRRVKKNGPQAIGKSRGGWTTKIHLVAANARTAISFALSPGQASDAKQGRLLLGGIGPLPAPVHLIMDRAYEDNETRQLALDFGFIPVVPPKSNRLEPWQYDKALYRKRNEVEQLSFGGLRASGASSPASTNSTPSFSDFSTSP